jgi:hypothetical protein
MSVSRNGLVWCEDERRSGVLRAPTHPLNGLDFVEYRRDPPAPPERRHVLEVTFLKPPPAGLVGAPAAFTVLGGVRVVAIRVLAVETDPANPLRVRVFLDREGDFSVYILAVAHADVDPERSEARFGFKAGCPTPFDCRATLECPPSLLPEPALDYLAKDYQSFRRLMLDLVAERNPGWQERLAADLGIGVVELFAYVGDYLSYYQDAAGAEGYLDSCLQRVSARRHARLVDYRMHDGRNAVTWVHFAATPGTDGVVPAGTKLVTRVTRPLRGDPAAPPPVLPETADFDGDPALGDAVVFETTARVRVAALHNALRIHTWGDAECCLARGAREAFLYGVPTGADPTAFRPELEVGDYLLLEEARSPATGAAADADPLHRQVVRLVTVEDTVDPAYRDVLVGGELTPRAAPAEASLPLQRVAWAEADALGFTLCLSADTPETGPIDPVALARGNVAPADHGRTVERVLPPPTDGAELRWPLPSLPLDAITDPLPVGPLTLQAIPAEPRFAPDRRLTTGRHDLARDARDTMPAVVLTLSFPGGEDELWQPVPHLLDSGPYDQHFVAEVDDAGVGHLRFGDDQYGRRPFDAEATTARWRLGNGRAGNLGAGALLHVVRPTAAELVDPADPGGPPAVFADVAAVYQPLAAWLGTDPESVEEVRQLAPEAFRAIQFRAVTERDWEEAALRHPDVAAAKARYRWTGSWHTVFVAIHPRDERHLIRLAGGGAALAPEFATAMRVHLVPYKLAGYDLVVRAAQYVPLEIALTVCVARGHFRGDVLAAVTRALSNRAFADGTRGFFHPLEFVFGQPVYLSRLYAAVEAVPGVESLTVQVFKRYWEVPRDELARGQITLGPFEIARLDNDPNQPEHGVLTIAAVGGQ